MAGEVTAVDILKRANKILAKKANWTKEYYARDETGKGVEVRNENARQFCLRGATGRAAVELEVDFYSHAVVDADTLLDQALERTVPNALTVVDFNDDRFTRFRDVKRLLKAAIELGEERGL